MMGIDNLGVYIHIPFCKRKCNYCDFCSFSDKLPSEDTYIDALIKEIQSFYLINGKRTVNTLFLGGGTPSLLSEKSFLRVNQVLQKCFDFADDVEYTIELNPGTVTKNKLNLYRKLGVNRLSIGLQSFNSNELSLLGRIHTVDEFITCFNLARESGFGNISVDVMYGIPEQTIDSLLYTIDSVIKLNPEHISAYGLILEEGTVFWNQRDILKLPDEDTEYNMYECIHHSLEKAGYSHYEISNYAKAGYESHHNLRYWRMQEYIGFGLNAHSFFLGKRFYNTSSFSEYLDNSVEKYRCYEDRSSEDGETEYIMLGLRTADGISFAKFKECFGKNFVCGREDILLKYANEGYATLDSEHFALNYRGFYISNSIISSLI